MKLENLIIRVDELLQRARNLLTTKKTNYDGELRINSSAYSGVKTSVLSFLLKIYDKNHPYYTEIEQNLYYEYDSTTQQLINILESVKEELIGGWIVDFKGLVSAEIFANFMDMASHLLEENYKDAAAVMIGSVLEEHLRQLSIKNKNEVELIKNGKVLPKKADLLNSELAKLNVYNKLDQKNVTAWLDLRNKAAHGKYHEYNKAQVLSMYNSVMEFMTRNSI